MVLNVFIKTSVVSGIGAQESIILLAVDGSGTPNETITEQRSYSFNDKLLLDDIKELVRSGRARTKQEVLVRCILRETDVVTCSSNKYNSKKMIGLLKKQVTRRGHGLVLDHTYHLADTDYYVLSLVDDVLYKKAKQIEEYIGAGVTVVTENQLILSVLNRRGRSKQSVDDCVIINNKGSHYVCYVASESGIPYRILNIVDSTDILNISKATDVRKCMFIDCGKDMFGFSISIALTTGQITTPRLALLCQPVAEVSGKYVDSAEEILINVNSFEYKKYSRHRGRNLILQSLIVVALMVVAVLFVMAWLNRKGNIDLISEFTLKYVALGTNMPYVEKENYAFKLGHDRITYVVKSNGVSYSKVRLDKDHVHDNVAYVIFDLNIRTVTASVRNVLAALEDEGYKGEYKTNSKSGNLQLKFTVNSN